ncbi:MiaB/RimO family radical SAM methylthiotransferase [Methylobacterium oryzae CBMB20]
MLKRTSGGRKGSTRASSWPAASPRPRAPRSRRASPPSTWWSGPQSYHRLPDLLARSRERRVVDTEFPVEDKFDHLPRRRTLGASAFLTVQEGCDKFCAFCVVPYTRGAEVSRSVAAVLAEAEKLADGGVREITLIGQNVNAYHGDGPDGAPAGLAELVRAVAAIPGIARIRYTTSHPNDFDDALIRAHAEVPALMPYLHLPVQSGSDRILAAMNRRHTGDQYRRLIDRIRAARPDIALSSDFIVGFPAKPTRISPRRCGWCATSDSRARSRSSTAPAPARRPPTAPIGCRRPVMAARLAELQALLDGQRHAYQRAAEGQVFDVLVEKPGRHPGQVAGKTPHLLAVQFDAPPHHIGQVVPVRITAAGANSLFGELLPEAAAA